ncbi:MAG: translation initiation factor IF-1 [Candidatus Paceibacterota bacterium]
MTEKKDTKQVTGTVVEAYPDTRFKIELDDGSEMQAYLAGKMRKFRIKVLLGDRVVVELDPYGGRGRIVRRL